MIIGPDELVDSMYVIRVGTVRVITVDQKTRAPTVIQVLRPGDVFGAYALLGDGDAAREYDVGSASFMAGPMFVEVRMPNPKP